MFKKLIILLVVIFALGAVVTISSISAILPWFVTRSDQTITTVDVSDPPQIAIPILPAATQVLPSGNLYKDESSGFQLTYPVDWTLDPSKPLGSRASQALLLSPGTTAESLAEGGSRVSIVIYAWDPTNDLSAYVARRKAAWNASSSTIIEEKDLILADGIRAVSFIVESTDKQRDFILITTAGEKYLEIVGQGNLELIEEVAQTLSPVVEPSQNYQSEYGHFTLQYPSRAIFYENQQVSVDGVISSAENTIAIQDTSINGTVLSLTYFTLPDDITLADFIRLENDCLELSSLGGQSLSLQGHEALLLSDTNCGPYGTSYIYTTAGNMGYRFTIETHEKYSVAAPFVDPILKSFQTHAEDITAPICFTPEELLPFAFSPDATKLMVRARSGVQVFDLESGAQETFFHSTQDVITAALSPDEKVLAWSLDDNTIQLLRISDQKVLHTLSGHTDMVTKLRFSPDGDLLVSASHDLWVRVWNLQGEELRSIQAGALGIASSPDGSVIATVPNDGPVALWDAASGEKIKDLGGLGGYDTSDVEFSPDGQYLAADLVTGLFLWRISDASLVWNGVKNSMAVTFSPDGRYLAYSDVDDGNKVILAAPDTGQLIRVIDKMQSPVWQLFFSPNASLLAATDGVEIRVWQVEDGTLLAIGKATCP